MTEYKEDRLKDDVEKFLFPAVRTLEYVLANITRDARQEMSFSLNFKLVSRGDVETAIICPNEFGGVCGQLSEAVIALGGECHPSPGNTVCNLPRN
jgi:hypothetical protein